MDLRRFLLVLINPEKYFFSYKGQNIRVLNYGCGNRKNEYEIGVDVSQDTQADFIIADSEKLPFPDNYFDMAISRYVLEHVSNIFHVVNEIGRVLKPGGEFWFIVPHAFSCDSFDDPTHIRFFTLRTPGYFVGKANIHYAKAVFVDCKAYLRLGLQFPRLKIVRYPFNFILGTIGLLFPSFSEQLLKLPFLSGTIIVKLVKANNI